MKRRKNLGAAIVLGWAVMAGGSAALAATDGSLKWRFNSGYYVVSSPAVATDGTIYIGSEYKRIFALNPDGSMKWAYPSLSILLPGTDWFDAAPAIGEDGTIYAGNFNGKVYALNTDGTLKWTQETGSYIISSAAIGEDGTLYVGSGDGDVYALDPDDGSVLWTYQTGDWIDSSPAIGPDGTIYVGGWDSVLHAINPDGTTKWTVTTGDSIISSPAVAADGTVYIGSADGNLYAVQADGTVAWTFATGDVVDCSPAVGSDGTIYFGSADGYFYALRPDGSSAWTSPYDVGQGVFGGVLIRADGTIIFGASDRYVYALNANGTLKWKYATGDVVDSSAALGPDGTIYLGSYDRYIYALNGNGSGLAVAPWPKFRRDALNHGRSDAAEVVEAPTVVVPPQSQSVSYGDTVTFSVEAEGTLPFSYQWEKDGAEIAGAISPSLVLASVSGDDAGSYRVLVGNSAGSVWSAAAELVVAVPLAPSIGTQPRALVVTTGNRLSLWVNASGSEPLSYQWLKDDVEIAGATDAFFEIDASEADDAGSYTVRVSNAGGSVVSAAASVSVDPAATAQMTNLSARAVVGTGESILIPGFYVGGTGARRLLIRAVGPTLEDFGVSGWLADPMLTVYSGSTPLETNDNWSDAANAAEIAATAAEIHAFALPEGGLDAAALVDLSPAGYTVHVSGVDGSSGVALVEIYDVEAAGTGEGRLSNISARADAGSGDQIMIAGFYVSGTGARTLLIRAVGPTLSNYGVEGYLADPYLRLFAGSSQILANDDWGDVPDPDALAAAAGSAYAFSLESGSADAAMLVVLMPGLYTAQASSLDGSTGNVLIEVFEVP